MNLIYKTGIVDLEKAYAVDFYDKLWSYPDNTPMPCSRENMTWMRLWMPGSIRHPSERGGFVDLHGNDAKRALVLFEELFNVNYQAEQFLDGTYVRNFKK